MTSSNNIIDSIERFRQKKHGRVSANSDIPTPDNLVQVDFSKPDTLQQNLDEYTESVFDSILGSLEELGYDEELLYSPPFMKRFVYCAEIFRCILYDVHGYEHIFTELLQETVNTLSERGMFDEQEIPDC